MKDDLLMVECPTCGRPGALPVNDPSAPHPTRADHTRFVLLPPKYTVQQGACETCPQTITYKATCHGKYFCRKCSEAPCDCTRPANGGPTEPPGKGKPTPRSGLRVVK
jgi:hypothetical protein